MLNPFGLRAGIANPREDNSSLKRSGIGNQNREHWTGAAGENGGGFGGDGGRGKKRRGGVRGGRGATNNNGRVEDEELVTQRNLVCMGYNRNISCRDQPCTLDHKCNHKIGKGKICPETHRGKDHTH